MFFLRDIKLVKVNCSPERLNVSSLPLRLKNCMWLHFIIRTGALYHYERCTLSPRQVHFIIRTGAFYHQDSCKLNKIYWICVASMFCKMSTLRPSLRFPFGWVWRTTTRIITELARDRFNNYYQPSITRILKWDKRQPMGHEHICNSRSFLYISGQLPVSWPHHSTRNGKHLFPV